MLNQIVNRLQGQVRIRVETPFPERVLNLCGARNLTFWDMAWESDTAFTCRMSRRDFYVLRRAVKQLDCTLTVVRKEGVPFFLGRFRRRHALAAGALVCGTMLFFGSFFIWDFTVEGNVRVTEEEIVEIVEKVARQLSSQEQQVRDRARAADSLGLQDEAYKSYGVLRYARRLSWKDAMVFLSRLMAGASDGLLEFAEPCPIFSVMLGIQRANLQKITERPLSREELDVARASYIRAELPELKLA